MAYPGEIEILDRNNAVVKVPTRTSGDHEAPFTEIGHEGSPVDDTTNPFPVIQVGKYDAALGDSIMELPAPGLAAWKEFTAAYTSTQTGTAIWTPASGKVYVVRQVSIDWSGAEDGDIIVWGSASGAADTAYTEGTDRFICGVKGATPSTKGAGGIIRNGLWVGVDATYPVRVTSTNGIDFRVSVGGWEYTL